MGLFTKKAKEVKEVKPALELTVSESFSVLGRALFKKTKETSTVAGTKLKSALDTSPMDLYNKVKEIKLPSFGSKDPKFTKEDIELLRGLLESSKPVSNG